MSRVTKLTHEFVEFVPTDLRDGVLYVSVMYATATHRCCCGCGAEVVTPLSPTDWKMIFDGESISLDPSVGNWSFPCQSHYWIMRNKIRWAPSWSKEQVEAGRARDGAEKQRQFGSANSIQEHSNSLKGPAALPPPAAVQMKDPWWCRLRQWWTHR